MYMYVCRYIYIYQYFMIYVRNIFVYIYIYMFLFFGIFSWASQTIYLPNTRGPSPSLMLCPGKKFPAPLVVSIPDFPIHQKILLGKN